MVWLGPGTPWTFIHWLLPQWHCCWKQQTNKQHWLHNDIPPMHKLIEYAMVHPLPGQQLCFQPPSTGHTCSYPICKLWKLHEHLSRGSRMKCDAQERLLDLNQTSASSACSDPIHLRSTGCVQNKVTKYPCITSASPLHSDWYLRPILNSRDHKFNAANHLSSPQCHDLHGTSELESLHFLQTPRAFPSLRVNMCSILITCNIKQQKTTQKSSPRFP